MEIPVQDNRFSSEMMIRDYVAVLLRHKRLFVAVLTLVLALAAFWTVLTPKSFQSVATVVLRTNQNQQLFPSVGGSQRQQFVRQPNAELEYATSTFFGSQASQLSPPDTNVQPRYEEGDTRSSQLQFVARASTPEAAQAAAAAWAQYYLDARAESDVGEIAATIEGVEALISELEIEKDELLSPIQPIDDALLVETDPDVISRLTTQRLSLRQSLEDDLLPVSLQLRTLSQDLSNLRIASGYVSRPDNSARMSVEAGPGRKVAPLLNRNLGLGALLGLLAATAAVLAYESYRGVINTAADIQSLAPNTPVLARLPAFPRGTRDPRKLASQAGSTYAQALERVVSSMLYLRAQQPDRQMRVLFTSAVPSEGKTTVASHLALRLSATPTQTIVIDADLRRPDMHTALGIEQQRPGLSHLLLDRAPLTPHVKPLAKGSTVRVLAAGAATDDAATLLRQSFSDSLDSLPSDYELLVVDAPPVLAVTDAEVMSQSVDIVVLVVRAGRTTRSQLTETMNKLVAAEANVVGFVLVAAESNAANGYSNSYGYEIDADTERLTSNNNGTRPKSATSPASKVESKDQAKARVAAQATLSASGTIVPGTLESTPSANSSSYAKAQRVAARRKVSASGRASSDESATPGETGTSDRVSMWLGESSLEAPDSSVAVNGWDDPIATHGQLEETSFLLGDSDSTSSAGSTFISEPYDLGPFAITIESSDGELYRRFVELHAGFPRRAADQVRRLRLSAADERSVAYLDDERLARMRDPVDFELAVTRALNRRVLDAEPEMLHLHAGAVTKEGTTVLVIGSSMSGKSTLVAKLVCLGWEYLSDEQIGVTRDGKIVGYPRSVTLRSGSWSLFPEVVDHTGPEVAGRDRVEVAPTQFGSVYDGEPLVPTIVVSPDASVAEVSVESMTVADTVSLILSESLDSARAGKAGVAAMVAVASGAPAYKMQGQQIDAVCEKIAELAGEATAPGGVRRHVKVKQGESSLRMTNTEGWNFADGSAAIYNEDSGVLARLDKAGFTAWLELGKVSQDALPPDRLRRFASELAEAGLVLPFSGHADAE